jgi:hypothetical protein
MYQDATLVPLLHQADIERRPVMRIPVSRTSIEFAKAYRAEQVRDADQERTVSTFRRPRKRRGGSTPTN